MLKHEHHGSEVLVERLLLAIQDRNDPAFELVLAQLEDCADCWRNIAITAVVALANDRILQARGTSLAADQTLHGLAEVLMPDQPHIPEVDLPDTLPGIPAPAPGLLRRLWRWCRHPRT